MPRLRKKKSKLPPKQWQWLRNAKKNQIYWVGSQRDGGSEILVVENQPWSSSTSAQSDLSEVITKHDHTYSLTDGDIGVDRSDELTCAFKESSVECVNYVESEVVNPAVVYISCQEQTVTTVDFDTFREEVKSVIQGFHFIDEALKLILFQTYCQTEVTVKLAVTLNHDFTCQVSVHQKEIPKSHELWEGLPLFFHSIDSFKELCYRINCYHVCCGNPDEELKFLVPRGAGLTTTDNETTAYHEGDFHAVSNLERVYHGTIRTFACTLLTIGERCKHCKDNRTYLREKRERILGRGDPITVVTHSTYKPKDMSREELIKKFREQKQEIESLRKIIRQLERDMQVCTIENQETKDLLNARKKLLESNLESKQRIFWDQQCQAAKKADARTMRWHPTIIDWCLRVHQKSARAYDDIRKSGFMRLPSPRTLLNYTKDSKS